ncbi:histone deacetylase family protein [Pseudogulbenkiania subflava]|uniref:Acetoin utilization deacetylase AcuC n=1 Tax=Pseudogulbenkiania subflava DSM 22618 TaxID=1123014 RepID=A0A1Y6C334_9NEIS|nr:histone deacetylase family protein [Pseudogulbenkiania subflava]SMF33184.1 Acetoin utilization deacetylase AcuC [Pseudogulbenkiania subflava DSM 22618]
MLTIYSPAHRLHHATELKDGLIKPCFEMPSRADTILARVQAVGLGEVITPRDYDTSRYARVHSERYVRFLENAWAEWSALGRTHDALPLIWPVRDLRSDIEPEHIDGKLGLYAMDAGVAITAGTWEAVRTSANLALTGMAALEAGEDSAFALCRPPGHHAAAEYMGGYCYLNNAAIAAQACLDGGAKRVAVLDVDYHHGNGTQSIFYHRADAMFVSLHGDPKQSYPYFLGHKDEQGAGAGLGFNHNYPLPHGTAWDAYGAALAHACRTIAAYAPDAVVVSLGVDTFKDDPISHFQLDNEDFLRIGETVAGIGRPTLFVMEGGYMVDDIGINAVNVLRGFEAAR